MSEEITFRYLNAEQKEQLTFTMLQVLQASGYPVTDTARLELEICHQFGLLELGHLRPEQLEAVRQWLLSVWAMDQLQSRVQSVCKRLAELVTDVRTVYLLILRQSAARTTEVKRLVTIAAFVLFTFVSAAVSAQPVINPDSNIIARPFTARTDSDVLERAATPSAEQETDYGNDPARIFQAIQYASQFSLSVWVNRAFLVDCGQGFPQWDQLKDKIYLDAAILTEIPATNFSPAVYLLSAMDTAGDFGKGYSMLYLDSLLGAKMLYGFAPVESRVPNPFDSFGILYQNIYWGAAPLSFQEKRDSNRAPLTWCWGCIAAINRAATAVRETDDAAALATAGTVAVGCTKLVNPGAIAVCVGAAATGFGIAVKRNENIRAEKVVNARLGACSHDKTKNPPEACPWTK